MHDISSLVSLRMFHSTTALAALLVAMMIRRSRYFGVCHFSIFVIALFSVCRSLQDQTSFFEVVGVILKLQFGTVKRWATHPCREKCCTASNSSPSYTAAFLNAQPHTIKTLASVGSCFRYFPRQLCASRGLGHFPFPIITHHEVCNQRG
jgi:hypothetical protein